MRPNTDMGLAIGAESADLCKVLWNEDRAEITGEVPAWDWGLAVQERASWLLAQLGPLDLDLDSQSASMSPLCPRPQGRARILRRMSKAALSLGRRWPRLSASEPMGGSGPGTGLC